MNYQWLTPPPPPHTHKHTTTTTTLPPPIFQTFQENTIICSHFIFMGYLRKNEIKSAQRVPLLYISDPFSRNPGPAPNSSINMKISNIDITRRAFADLWRLMSLCDFLDHHALGSIHFLFTYLPLVIENPTIDSCKYVAFPLGLHCLST